MERKTCYVVEYATDRSCDVVYALDAVTRVARGTPIARVTMREREWFGSWDVHPPTRGFRTVASRVLDPIEYGA